MRLNWKNTFIIGLGFFGVGLVWPLYNAYMPIFYSKFIESKTIIGYLMTIDNWLALTLTPLVGFLSDRTRTRFGRRIPYLLVFAPLSALFLMLIPVGWETSLWLLLGASIMMNLSMASWRSPIVALMPDVTPAPLRSKANGIINFMGGLAYIVAMFGGAILYRMYPGLPFVGSALLLLLITAIFYLWIREPEHSTEKAERFQIGFIKDASALFMLLAIFCWFVAYNSLETWVTTYGREHLGMHEADVAGLLTFSGAAFLLFAIPSGFLADGFSIRSGRSGRTFLAFGGLGRKWTIIGGLIMMILAFFLLNLQSNLKSAWYLFLLVGFAWSWVNINSYPMITQMAGPGQIGAYTGMYYLFSSAANIAGPPLFGWVFDHYGYGYFFLLGILFMALAALCMMAVRRGEKEPPPAEQA